MGQNSTRDLQREGAVMQAETARILIVDDEAYICQLLARYLVSDGYECITALSGEDALKFLEADKFDLVITDIMMPGMSGMDLLNIIRSLYTDVAVMMVTAVNDRETGVLAVELGAFAYLIKPFERNELLINVANALERRRLKLAAAEAGTKTAERPVRLPVGGKPVKISAAEAVKDIRSGMDDASLMEKFNLSAKALHSLFDQLIVTGHLRQSEIDERGSLSPGTVVVDIARLKFPERDTEKPVISATKAVKHIRSGMDDATLMKRFGISARGLRSLFRKLVAAGLISSAELDQRMSESHQWAVLDGIEEGK